MSTHSDFDRTAQAWLAEGPSELADRVLDAALSEVHLTHQRRHPWVTPWRSPLMNTPLRAAAGIAIVAVLGLAAFSLVGVGAAPTPSPTAATTPSPTQVVTVAPTVLGPIDTAAWVTYTSTRYQFTIGHPADWTVTASNHAWAFPADATEFPPSAGETFISPSNDVAVSAYSLAVAPGTTAAAWIQAYCLVAENDSPCTALQGLTDVASMDGHVGAIVRFKGDTQAFILIGNRLYIVGCWRSESDPPVATYGGATRLLEAYLSTMHLLPGGPASPAPTVRPS
jgi:hypothetical protein